MASPFIEAMSTAIIDGNSVSQQLIPHNHSVGSAVKLASAIGNGISSTFRWLSTCTSFLFGNWGLLILVIHLYLVWAVCSRYNRVKAIKAKYGFSKDPRTYQDMTVDVAQEVEKNLAEWEMPWLFELGWLINFLAVSKPSFCPHVSLHESTRVGCLCLPVSLSIISLLSVCLFVCPCVHRFLDPRRVARLFPPKRLYNGHVNFLARYTPLPQ